MSHDHHHHEHQDPFKTAMVAEFANQMRAAAPYIMNKAVYATLSSAVGSLRETAYRFAPIDPSELIADPHPLDVRNTELPTHMGVLLHNRLLQTANSYLVIVRYDEVNNGTHAPYTSFSIAVTKVHEEALNTASNIVFDEVIKNEITRQIAKQPPMAPGVVKLLGLTIAEGFFSQDHIDSYWDAVGGEPAARDAQAAGVNLAETQTNTSGLAEHPENYPAAEDLTTAKVEPLVEDVTPRLVTRQRPAMPKPSLPEPRRMSEMQLDPTKPRATPTDRIPSMLATKPPASASGSSVPDISLSALTPAKPAAPKQERPAMPSPKRK